MKFSMKLRTAALIGAFLGTGLPLTAAESDAVRTIHLRQDDAQVRFESKLYELKHVPAEEILPFINSAIQRYNRNSTIRRVTSEQKGTDAILVSTGRNFLPHVDAIVAALDRPGTLDENDSAIAGTGLARVAYSPRYRAAADFSNIVNATIGSSAGSAYVNLETNTIFGIFLHSFKSFSSGEHCTAYPFVTDISGIILPTPVHTCFYLVHNIGRFLRQK